MATLPRERIDPRYHEALDKAIQEYRDAQGVVLERAASHMNLGWLARQLGDPKEAEEEFRTAIRLEPYLTGPRSELATLIAHRSGDEAEIRKLREEEADLLDRDAKLLSTSAETYYRLGLLRYLLGETTAASTALKKACELAPTNYDFRMALALLQERRYEQSGDAAEYDAAIASLNELAKLQPNDPRAAQIRARLDATHAAKQVAPPPAETP
jgi:tetratricopeptide (TPR) repeat protein